MLQQVNQLQLLSPLNNSLLQSPHKTPIQKQLAALSHTSSLQSALSNNSIAPEGPGKFDHSHSESKLYNQLITIYEQKSLITTLLNKINAQKAHIGTSKSDTPKSSLKPKFIRVFNTIILNNAPENYYAARKQVFRIQKNIQQKIALKNVYNQINPQQTQQKKLVTENVFNRQQRDQLFTKHQESVTKRLHELLYYKKREWIEPEKPKVYYKVTLRQLLTGQVKKPESKSRLSTQQQERDPNQIQLQILAKKRQIAQLKYYQKIIQKQMARKLNKISKLQSYTFLDFDRLMERIGNYCCKYAAEYENYLKCEAYFNDYNFYYEYVLQQANECLEDLLLSDEDLAEKRSLKELELEQVQKSKLFMCQNVATEQIKQNMHTIYGFRGRLLDVIPNADELEQNKQTVEKFCNNILNKQTRNLEKMYTHYSALNDNYTTINYQELLFSVKRKDQFNLNTLQESDDYIKVKKTLTEQAYQNIEVLQEFYDQQDELKSQTLNMISYITQFEQNYIQIVHIILSIKILQDFIATTSKMRQRINILFKDYDEINNLMNQSNISNDSIVMDSDYQQLYDRQHALDSGTIRQIKHNIKKSKLYVIKLVVLYEQKLIDVKDDDKMKLMGENDKHELMREVQLIQRIIDIETECQNILLEGGNSQNMKLLINHFDEQKQNVLKELLVGNEKLEIITNEVDEDENEIQ